MNAPTDSTVATVNDQSISLAAGRTALAADRAMNRLLGLPITRENDLLDRLVNTELVRQAAGRAGFQLTEAEVTQALADFLTGLGKTQAELTAALAVAGISAADFQSYFGNLILADQFTQMQAQALGLTVDIYLGRLQETARISFGPAAQALRSAAALIPPTATVPPMAAPTAPASSPTTTITISRGTDIGQLAPEFTLPALGAAAGQVVRLADLIGRPTVLSFWTTWCPHCQRQTPVLVEAAARYADRDIQFVGINVREERPIVQNYVQTNGIPYPIALDTQGQIADLYRVSGYPTTYFLDATGQITAQHIGQLSDEQIEVYLTQLVTSSN